MIKLRTCRFFVPSEDKVKVLQKVSTIRKSLAGLENSIIATFKRRKSLDVVEIKQNG